MQIFRFTNPTNKTKMEAGVYVNGITDIMWIERYAASGEFTFKSPISAGIKEQLPTGSFISHTESKSIMVVESHEINDNEDGGVELTTTGRTIDTLFENRVVGGSATPAVYPRVTGAYTLAYQYTWNQAVKLLNDHSISAANPNDHYNFLQAATYVYSTGVTEDRVIPRKTVYNALYEILAIDNLGVRVVRPGPFNPLDPVGSTTVIEIYLGRDLSADIIFSYDAGDLQSGDYLWSNKGLKTAVLVVGHWFEVMVGGTTETSVDRRLMVIDGSSADQDYQTRPATGSPEYTTAIALLTTMGKQALAAAKQTTIANVDISRNAIHYHYRRDFDLGDIVQVAGDYDAASKKRIIEYVEIEDVNGESSYPTLGDI